MHTFEAGQRVRVAQLIKEEPCSDIDVLINQVGTVTNPNTPDEDYDGNLVTKIQVTPKLVGAQQKRMEQWLFQPQRSACRN